jgi:diguanylate cyclase (GGDEF)-like protein
MDNDAQLSKILCVDNDPGELASLRSQLDRNFEFHAVTSPEQALEMIKESGPYEAIITGLQAGDRSPDYSHFFDKVKSLSPATVRIMLAEESAVPLARQAIDQGEIYRFLVKPCSEEELVTAINSAVLENTRTIHKQHLQAETDELASAAPQFRAVPIFDAELGIGSAEALEIELEYTHNVAVRYKRPYSIAIFDLDIFKIYASHYGKKAAKLAHKLLAEHIRHSCRSADRLYRFGEETQIILILPETDANGCRIFAQRAVQSFAARNIPNSKSEHKLLTISGSLSAYDPLSDAKSDWDDMVDEALLYLHIAQGQGGNCISHVEAW